MNILIYLYEDGISSVPEIAAAYSLGVVVDTTVFATEFLRPLKRWALDSSSVLARSEALSRGGSHMFS